MTIRLRPVLAVAVCAALAAGTGIAAAAPAPVCNLITDAKGDGTATILTDEGGPNDPSWDILSADVASTKKGLTTVIRVDKLAASALTSPGGVQWRVNFTAGDKQLFTQVVSTRSGLVGRYGYVDTLSRSLGGAPATVDMAKNEIRITVPDKGFAAQATIKKVGTTLTDMTATAGRYYDLVAVTGSEPSDGTEVGKSYTTGTASCVTK